MEPEPRCGPSPFADGRCALHGASFPPYPDSSGTSRYCLVQQVETNRCLAEAARRRAEHNRQEALSAEGIATRLDAEADRYARALADERQRP